jgi:hypothetical protein
MPSSVDLSTPRGPFAGSAPLALRPLSAIAATVAGGVPQGRIQRIIAELIPELEKLHRVGQVCGDISVHSVGLDESGKAHLLALSNSAAAEKCLSSLTPGYAPAELYIESSDWPQGPWTDIYALSAIAYSLVAGQRPPPATERLVADNCQPLETLGLRNYSEAFLQAIDAGLAIAPIGRPQTLKQFAELLALPALTLTAIDQDDVTEALPPSGINDTQAADSRWSKGTVVRSVLLGVIAVGVAVYWWGRLVSDSAPIIKHSESIVKPTQTRVPIAAVPSPSLESLPTVQPAKTESSDEQRILVTEPTQTGEVLTSSPETETSPAVSVEKVERKAPVPPAPVRVSINVRPWGEIVIDGVSHGVTPPLKTVMLRPGKYTVSIRNTAQPPFNTTLVVTAGKPAVITHLFR